MQCAVKSCNSNSKERNISFFHFPRDKELRKQWVQFCGISEPFSKYWRVCEHHFRNKDIMGKVQRELGIGRRLRLEEGAVPSIVVVGENKSLDFECEDVFNYGDAAVPSFAGIGENTIQEFKCEDVLNYGDVAVPSITGIDEKKIQASKCAVISKYGDVASGCSVDCRTEMVKLNMELMDLRRENKKLVTAARKKDEYTKTLKTKDNEIRKLEIMLQNSDRVCKNMEDRLQQIFTTGQIQRLKEGGRNTHWSAEDIARSYSLYSASPKGYKLLRKKQFPLPGVRTLQRWASKI